MQLPRCHCKPAHQCSSRRRRRQVAADVVEGAAETDGAELTPDETTSGPGIELLLQRPAVKAASTVEIDSHEL